MRARPRDDWRAPWCGRARQAPSGPAVDPFARVEPSMSRRCETPADANESPSRGERRGAPRTPAYHLESHTQNVRSKRPNPRPLRVMAEQGELLPERQVLKREIGAGSERSTRVSQESEYEGHCAQRRSASSR